MNPLLHPANHRYEGKELFADQALIEAFDALPPEEKILTQDRVPDAGRQIRDFFEAFNRSDFAGDPPALVKFRKATRPFPPGCRPLDRKVTALPGGGMRVEPAAADHRVQHLH